MTHSGRIRVDQPSDAAIATEGGDKAQEPVEGEAGDEVGDGAVLYTPTRIPVESQLSPTGFR